MKRIFALLPVVLCLLFGSIPASAAPHLTRFHTPQVTANCVAVHVNLANYEGTVHNNNFMHQTDGSPNVIIEEFGGSLGLVGTLAWPALSATHTFTWWIDANILTGDPTQWDVPATTLTVHGCPTPPVTTTIPPTTTTTVPIPTTTVHVTTTTGAPPSTTTSVLPSTTTTTPSVPTPPSTSGTTAPTSSTPDTSPRTPTTLPSVTSAVSSTTETPRPTTALPPSTNGPPVSGAPSTASGTQLPATGSKTGVMVGIALLLLLIGFPLWMLRSPRKVQHHDR